MTEKRKLSKWAIALLLLLSTCIIGVALILVLQLVPYGRNHTNPPVTSEPAWDSPVTRELAQRACFDCHSNETTWPWYSSIAPGSWLIQRDVEEGRQKLNFSEWNATRIEADEIFEVIQEGEMPPFQFLILHPNAKLSAAERQQLSDGLNRTISNP